MMYQAYVALPEKSAFDALQRLLGEEIDTNKYLKDNKIKINQGSITYEELDSESALELQIKSIQRTQHWVLRAKISAKNGHDKSSTEYRRLKDIYTAMKERHGEAITPFGLMCPSKGIGLNYYVEKQGDNGVALRAIDIVHICLN